MLKRNPVLFLVILLIGLSGCQSVDLSVPGFMEDEQQPIQQEPIKILKMKTLTNKIEAKKIPFIENGAIVMPNNERVFDERGDIIKVLHANHQYFYILQTRDTFELKNLVSKKVIKKFDAPVGIQSFQDVDDIILAIKWNEQSNIYDNVYSFNGKNLKLINKNIVIPFASTRDGIYAMKGMYKAIEGSAWAYTFYGYHIVNMFNGQIVKLESQYPEIVSVFLLGKHKSPIKYTIGVIGDNIFYAYEGYNGKSILEVYNGKTNSRQAILETNNKLQFLKYENQIVVKIFDDRNLETERELGSHNINTAYSNMSAKYISLNLLANVPSVSQEFKPIILKGNFARTKEAYITYSLKDLETAFSHFMQSATLRLLF